MIIVLNADGTRRFVSPSVTRLLGYDTATYLAFPTFELIHPDDVKRVAAGHADCLANPGPQNITRYRLRHADGSWRTFEAIRSNLLQNPAVCGLVITARDVTEAERARRRLFESEAQFRSAFDYASIGMALVGLDGRWLTVNHALCTITGYTSDELLSRSFQEITHPEDLDNDLALVSSLLAGEIETYQLEKRYLHKLGHVVWVLLSVSLVRDEQRQPRHFISQIQDVSSRRAAEQTLRDSEARFRALLANAADIVLLLDARGRVRWASDSVHQLLGLAPGCLIGRSNVELVHPNDRATLRRAFVETMRAVDEPHRVAIRFRHQDGTYRWLESVGVNHLDNPAIGGVVINARDISDSVALQDRLRKEAMHDPLTGLPNRVMFEERVRFNLDSVRRYGGATGVVFVDLNKFKQINDSLGHAAGDAVLALVGMRLTGNVRPTDLVSRLGGDEFAIAVGRLGNADEISIVVDRLHSIFDLLYPVAGLTISVAASIGWAVSDNGLDDPVALLAAADESMYQVKHREDEARARPIRSSSTRM